MINFAFDSELNEIHRNLSILLHAKFKDFLYGHANTFIKNLFLKISNHFPGFLIRRVLLKNLWKLYKVLDEVAPNASIKE